MKTKIQYQVIRIQAEENCLAYTASYYEEAEEWIRDKIKEISYDEEPPNGFYEIKKVFIAAREWE